MFMWTRNPSFSKRTTSPSFSVLGPLKPNSIVLSVVCAAGSAAGAAAGVIVSVECGGLFGLSPSAFSSMYVPGESTVCATAVPPGLPSSSKTIEPSFAVLFGSPNFFDCANASNSATLTPGFSWNRTVAGSFRPFAAVVTMLTAPDTVDPDAVIDVLVTDTFSVGSGAALDAAGAASAASEPAVTAAATTARRGDRRLLQRFI